MMFLPRGTLKECDVVMTSVHALNRTSRWSDTDKTERVVRGTRQHLLRCWAMLGYSSFTGMPEGVSLSLET
jgi:hypothetical protein